MQEVKRIGIVSVPGRANYPYWQAKQCRAVFVRHCKQWRWRALATVGEAHTSVNAVLNALPESYRGEVRDGVKHGARVTREQVEGTELGDKL